VCAHDDPLTKRLARFPGSLTSVSRVSVGKGSFSVKTRFRAPPSQAATDQVDIINQWFISLRQPPRARAAIPSRAPGLAGRVWRRGAKTDCLAGGACAAHPREGEIVDRPAEPITGWS
jgi:hypothetical protein